MDVALSRNGDRIDILTEALTDLKTFSRLVGRYVVQVQASTARRFDEDEIPIGGFEGAVLWLLRRTNVLRGQFDAWRRETGRKAFTIARVFEEGLLGRIKRTLAAALGEGETFEEWQQRLTESDGGEPSIMEQVGVGALGDYHAETVFRAQWQNSYQAAIRDGYQETRDAWAFYEYVTMDDDRVRPAHAAMHGVRRPVNDPIWRTWWPPNGYNCRCTVVAISHAEAAEDGLRPNQAPRDESPDDGWEGVPGA